MISCSFNSKRVILVAKTLLARVLVLCGRLARHAAVISSGGNVRKSVFWFTPDSKRHWISVHNQAHFTCRLPSLCGTLPLSPWPSPGCTDSWSGQKIISTWGPESLARSLGFPEAFYVHIYSHLVTCFLASCVNGENLFFSCWLGCGGGFLLVFSAFLGSVLLGWGVVQKPLCRDVMISSLHRESSRED